MKIAKTGLVKTPTRGTKASAGIDFYLPTFTDEFFIDLITKNQAKKYDTDGKYIYIHAHSSLLIPLNIKAEVPKGFALIAYNKSGVCTKKGLIAGACVVDSDYTGNIHVHLINTTNKAVEVIANEKIIQFLLMPVDHCEIEEINLEDIHTVQTERGEGGFGSTGN